MSLNVSLYSVYSEYVYLINIEVLANKQKMAQSEYYIWHSGHYKIK